MIPIESTELEDSLKFLLQKCVVFRVNGKQWKTGQVLLFNQSMFYTEIILDTIKKRDRFEIPVPFRVERWDEDGLVYLDYSFKSISRGSKSLYTLLERLHSDRKSRFYNAVLEIEVQHDV